MLLLDGKRKITLYFLLIIFFTYFYTEMQYNPVEMSNNMKQNGLHWIQYADDNNEFLPFARKSSAEFIFWTDVVKDYVSTSNDYTTDKKSTFCCLNFNEPNAYKGMSYMLNGYLSNTTSLSLVSIKRPLNTIYIMDGNGEAFVYLNGLQYTAGGDKWKARYRHNNSINFAFIDGHVLNTRWIITNINGYTENGEYSLHP